MDVFLFSQLVGKPLLDTREEKVATLKDIIVRVNPESGTTEEVYPHLEGVLAHTAGRDVWLSAKQIASFGANAIRLISSNFNLERFSLRDGEILLGRDVLDKQLIDVQGRRVIRVNDLVLGHVLGEQLMRLLAVDVSFRALSRRIFFSWSRYNPRPGKSLLDWANVQYFGSLAPAVRLHISHERLSKLHPADLARILEDLSHQQRDEVVRSLENEVVANTLEYLSSNEAADILEEIPEERASDILEEMHPDMAADVVADLDEEIGKHLLQLMEPEESQDVRELLAYPRKSAGGMMTNDFVLLPAHLAIEEALRIIRGLEERPEFVDYFYVTESDSERVIGVVALNDIVLNPDRTASLHQLMKSEIISVDPQAPAEEAAALLTTYGLRGVPVIDEQDVLQGVVTIDDALDILLPEQIRERLEYLSSYRREHEGNVQFDVKRR